MLRRAQGLIPPNLFCCIRETKFFFLSFISFLFMIILKVLPIFFLFSNDKSVKEERNKKKK